MYRLPHPLLLRNATPADAAFTAALYASTRDDLRQLPMPAPMIEQLVAFQQRARDAGERATWPRAEVLILECDGLAAGRVVLDASVQPWRLVDIALLPAMRGQGYGGAVLRALQERACTHGAAIGLAVLHGNAGAIHAYERAGFSIASSSELHHEMLWQPGLARA